MFHTFYRSLLHPWWSRTERNPHFCCTRPVHKIINHPHMTMIMITSLMVCVCSTSTSLGAVSMLSDISVLIAISNWPLKQWKFQFFNPSRRVSFDDQIFEAWLLTLITIAFLLLWKYFGQIIHATRQEYQYTSPADRSSYHFIASKIKWRRDVKRDKSSTTDMFVTEILIRISDHW